MDSDNDYVAKPVTAQQNNLFVERWLEYPFTASLTVMGTQLRYGYLRKYNESRLYGGKYRCGKTPIQTLQDSLPPAKEKYNRLSDDIVISAIRKSERGKVPENRRYTGCAFLRNVRNLSRHPEFDGFPDVFVMESRHCL